MAQDTENQGGEGQQGQQGGGTVPEWAKDLPEDIRGSNEIARYTDLESFVKGHNELRGAYDGKIPTSESTDEERSAWWDRQGRPETAEGYEVTKPENLPEGVGWSEDNLNLAKAVAHKAGLTQDQFKAFVDYDTQGKIDSVADAETAQKAYIAESTATLKKDWGGAYDQEVKRSMLTTKAFCTDEQYKALEDANLTSDPDFLRFTNRVGRAMAEGKRPDFKSENFGGVMTPADAAKAQAAISGDDKNPLNAAFHDKGHADHQKAVDEFAKLGRMKRGDKDNMVHLD